MTTAQPKKKVRRSLNDPDVRRDILLSLGALIIVCLFLFPIYWLIQMSFKSDGEIFGKPITYFPQKLSLDGYRRNFGDQDYIRSLINSIVISLETMGLSMIFGIPAAYGLGRYKSKLLHAILLVLLVSQMLPASVMLTPLYLIFNRAGMLNNLITPAIAITASSIPFTCVTLRPYFKSIPTALDDAARIDGAGVLKSFFYIMLPTVKYGAVTCAAISFLNGWNDLLYSMTFNVNALMRPLTANINKFKDSYGTKWNAIMAYGAILIIPVLLIFIFLQKQIIGGLTAGAVKE